MILGTQTPRSRETTIQTNMTQQLLATRDLAVPLHVPLAGLKQEMRHPETNCFNCLHMNVCIMVGRQESLGYCEIVDDSFSLGQQSTLLALVTTSLSDYSARRPSHQLLFDAPLARPRTQGCRLPDITHRCCSCRLTSTQQDSSGHACHNTMGCRPLISGGDHLSHKEPHMTSSQTPQTQMSAVPTSKMATKSTLMTSSSTLTKSTMVKIKSSKT